jgi:hypothetical protein
VWTGALREWSEETGARLPNGCEPRGGWVSDDGVYEGFVVQVAHESDLSLAPQQDEVSSAKWWDPDDLDDPTIREKLTEQLADIEPILKASDEIVDQYSQEIRDTMADLLSADTIQAAMRVAFQATKAQQPTSPSSQNVPNYQAQLAALGAVGLSSAAMGGGSLSGVPGAILGAVRSLLTAPLALAALIAILRRLYLAAAVQAASDAARSAGLHLPEALPSEVADGLQAEIIARGIAETEAKRIAEAIADASSPEEASARVDAILHDGARATLISTTEYMRAAGAAMRETYRRNGVARLRWVAYPDCCERCRENADVSPIPVGNAWPNGGVPIHPACRCHEVPDGPARRPIL